MKISELVKFRNELQERVSSLRLSQPIGNVCSLLSSTITSNVEVTEQYTSPITNYTNRIQALLDESHNIIDELEQYIIELSNQIDALAVDEYGDEHKQQWHSRFIDGFLFREFFVTTEISKLVKSRIAQYVDWHYPVLQFGCRYNGQEPRKPKSNFTTLASRQNDPDLFLEVTDGLVGGEPLYVCDFNKENMQRCVKKFNPEYQQKICQYHITAADFTALPQEQFAFILSWNLFNYATLDVIREYLTELYKLLRPGGVIMLSYNNCDLMESMVLTEIGLASYMPKRQLVGLCEELEFEVLQSYDIVNEIDEIPFTHISWLEIKKAGELSTSKAHTVLGKIVIK